MILLIIAAVFAALEWYAEYKKNKTLIYLSKPTMMVFLIAWVFVYSGVSTFPLLWFVIALIFCLGGDIFLMLPQRFFLPGLISFLAGHIFYIVGFENFIPTSDSLVAGLTIALVLVTAFVIIYRKLARGMLANNKANMRIPVAIYAIVISIMLYAALITNYDAAWQSSHAIIVSVGALLFYLSDILNAWTRFVNPFPYDRLLTMIAYHLGQIALAAGAALHFMN